MTVERLKCKDCGQLMATVYNDAPIAGAYAVKAIYNCYGTNRLDWEEFSLAAKPTDERED
jgi:hypothetical protein